MLTWSSFLSYRVAARGLDTPRAAVGMKVLFIYVFGGGLVFCLRFWLFARQKQHILANFEAKKGKREETKRKTKIGRAFSGRKVHFFPNLSNILTKT